jgi:hypothetical protein
MNVKRQLRAGFCRQRSATKSSQTKRSQELTLTGHPKAVQMKHARCVPEGRKEHTGRSEDPLLSGVSAWGLW